MHEISQEEFEDGEDDMKDCTIDEKEGEWMGKTTMLEEDKLE